MNRRDNFAQGRFYPSDPHEIRRMFEEAVRAEGVETIEGSHSIIGGVAPHAGYIYCTSVAVHLFEGIRRSRERYDTVVLINPNHTGYGYSIEADISDSWITPLGEIEVDTELRERLQLDEGLLSQKFEHSGEVLLPYLKHFLEYEFKVVPICIMDHRPEKARAVAESIVREARELGRKILVIASSDFTHFKTRDEGRRLDEYALESIEKLDAEEFYSRVRERDISICGLGPIMILMEYLKLAAEKPEMRVLARGDSGEVTGDREVVDYVSLAALDRK